MHMVVLHTNLVSRPSHVFQRCNIKKTWDVWPGYEATACILHKSEYKMHSCGYYSLPWIHACTTAQSALCQGDFHYYASLTVRICTRGVVVI